MGAGRFSLPMTTAWKARANCSSLHLMERAGKKWLRCAGKFSASSGAGQEL